MRNERTKRLVTISLFVAIVVVLQTVATFINFGGFPITLTLVPIIVAGALFGPGVGALCGTAFGVVVAVMVITGADPSGAGMLALHPFITLTTCVLKGTLAGLVSALAYHGLKNRNQTLAIFVASALAPITNTTTLFLVIIIWFGGTFAALLGALMSVNFIIELVIDILLAPGLLRVINSYGKR